MTPRARPSVTSQSRSSHHNNMKVFVALAGLVAVTSAYPMFLLEDGYAGWPAEPVYRVARQAVLPDGRRPQMADEFEIMPSRFAQAARRRIQEEDDLETAADAAYGAAVSFITDNASIILDLNTCNDCN